MLCMQRNCTDITTEEHNRIKVERNREKFHHSWLGNKTTSFCQQTAMFGPVYIEGEVFFCLLCKKHQTSNNQNKEVKSTVEPCVRIKDHSFSFFQKMRFLDILVVFRQATKLALIWSKMHQQHHSLPFLPLASRFMTFWFGRAQKSKF